MEFLLEPFAYEYMQKAILACGLIGGVCAALSCYLIMKGWSLMGDALAHSVVPGVALAYFLALPYSIGAFFTGILAALSMYFVKYKTKLREDAVIGIIFTTFFAIGLLLISINPVAVNLQGIILGNVLSISNMDLIQVISICVISFFIIAAKWKDLLIIFFDESYAQSIGLPVAFLKILFFTLLSAVTVAALQAVGACLVIAMVVTPGATAYLLTDRFGVLLSVSVLMGIITGIVGSYASYFLNITPGGLIVCLQTMIFLCAFLFAPKYGLFQRQKGVA